MWVSVREGHGADGAEWQTQAPIGKQWKRVPSCLDLRFGSAE